MPQRPRGRPPADPQTGPRTAAERSRARRERDRLKVAALEAEIGKLRGALHDEGFALSHALIWVISTVARFGGDNRLLMMETYAAVSPHDVTNHTRQILERHVRRWDLERFDRNMIEIGATTMIAHAEAEKEAQERRRAKEAAEDVRRAAAAAKTKTKTAKP